LQQSLVVSEKIIFLYQLTRSHIIIQTETDALERVLNITAGDIKREEATEQTWAGQTFGNAGFLLQNCLNNPKHIPKFISTQWCNQIYFLRKTR